MSELESLPLHNYVSICLCIYILVCCIAVQCRSSNPTNDRMVFWQVKRAYLVVSMGDTCFDRHCHCTYMSTVFYRNVMRDSLTTNITISLPLCGVESRSQWGRRTSARERRESSSPWWPESSLRTEEWDPNLPARENRVGPLYKVPSQPEGAMYVNLPTRSNRNIQYVVQIQSPNLPALKNIIHVFHISCQPERTALLYMVELCIHYTRTHKPKHQGDKWRDRGTTCPPGALLCQPCLCSVKPSCHMGFP